MPVGDVERLIRLPSLIGKQINITGIGWMQSAADILLSSVGMYNRYLEVLKIILCKNIINLEFIFKTKYYTTLRGFLKKWYIVS